MVAEHAGDPGKQNQHLDLSPIGWKCRRVTAPGPLLDQEGHRFSAICPAGGFSSVPGGKV